MRPKALRRDNLKGITDVKCKLKVLKVKSIGVFWRGLMINDNINDINNNKL